MNASNAPKRSEGATGESDMANNYALPTRAIHSGCRPNEWAHGPVVPPIYLTTTFEVREPGHAVYDYSRCNNPTRNELEKLMASVESARYGLAFSSGLGAVTTAAFLLDHGQKILCCDDVYGGTFRLFSRCIARMGIDTTYVDGTIVENWTNNFEVGKTKLVWIETPTNPTLKVIDIESVVKAVKALDKDCIIVVDNTFITSIFQSPLKLGADMVMHSCSKYFGGHSDILMGALMTNNEAIFEKLKFLQNSLGIVPSPFDCSQMIRSIKTLSVRVTKQSDNAACIAKFLESHQLVVRVLYPGLKSHPQHAIAKKQCSGFGAMLSVYIKVVKGDEPARFVNAVKLFKSAESLGCVCSLIEIPALMTHASVPEETRNKLGITNNLLRVSVGIEQVEDLINDLENAFKIVYSNTNKK